MSYLFFIIQCLYFMLPAYLANMAPVLVRKLPFLNYPIDFNKRFKGQPIFGKHKTYRGFLFAVIFGIITAFIQSLINYQPLNLIDYTFPKWLIIGFLLGFGAIFGDLIKSFFKRRFSIKSGDRFFPFDQLDFVVGALLFCYPFLPSLKVAITLLIISPLLHIVVNHIAYYTKIRKEAW